MFLMMLLSGLSGVFWAAYGVANNWSLLKVMFYSGVSGLIIGVLSITQAHADSNTAYTKLLGTTVHIAIGSGSIVEAPSGKHYLLTNWHVCNAGQWLGKMRANYEDGTLIEGEITKSDATVDLCATLVSKKTPAIKIAKELSFKEQIYTRGYPFGVLSQTTGQYVGKQSWSYFYPIEEVGECFRGSRPVRNGYGNIGGCEITYHDNVTNLYSRPGSSGSPVVDDSGNLVGVISSWYGEKDAGGMVRLEDVQAFMKGL